MLRQILVIVLVGLLGEWPSAGIVSGAAVDNVAEQLEVIAHVGRDGKGSAEAARARDRLLRHGVEIMPQLLAALDTSNIVAANWYRSILDGIVAREIQRSEPQWPLDELKQFVGDPRHPGRSRRWVLKLLDRIEPEFGSQFIPARLDDPEFRSEAVDWAIRTGDRLRDQKQLDQSREQYRAAFDHARDSQQVLLAARKLTAAGESVDPIRHLGFVTRWYLLGPFAAPGTSGFDLKFPPEERVELDKSYLGMDDRTVRWTVHETSDSLGQVNLIDAIARVREAVGFAYSEIHSPRDQLVELRCSADDNLTVWLNGERVLAQQQWLNGTRLDRFVTPVKLKSGTNRVLVKICQGPQHVNPEVPNNWSLQLRFCDSTGASAGCQVALPE